MPPPSRSHRAGGRLRGLLLAAALLTFAAAALYAVTRIGPYLARADPLVKGDAIFVLAGTRLVRPLEAGDLYLEGYTPIIVMTRATEEPAFREAARRGQVLLSDVARARNVLAALGVPARAILIPDRTHDSTASEAVTLRELAADRGWRRVIVVTSRFHLRRAGFAMRRELEGTGVQVIMHPSRYDPLRPEGWWRRRAEIRTVVPELAKLIAYRLGLGA